MSLSAIIAAIVGAIFSGVALYFRVKRSQRSADDRRHGRLEEIKDRDEANRKAMSDAKKVQDDTEALTGSELLGRLRRYVRRP